MAKNNETAAVTKEGTAIEEAKESPMDMVTITLFKDNDKYNDDVFVAVNGNNYLIQRGKPVTVPRYVAEVVEQAEKQRNRAEYFKTEGWKALKIEQKN